ncbi:hypothetical protein ACJJVG_08755 [Pseudocitrobacter faecalis]|uniref:hypothetical protein n=1 Tax=Pseudocitrobacter faecalis TaxID=1398493 RepID=UPI00389B1137
MPKLNSEQLKLVTMAGELLRKLEEASFEEDTDESRCYHGLKFFFGLRSPDEWQGVHDEPSYRYILNALAWMEVIVKFSQILTINK